MSKRRNPGNKLASKKRGVTVVGHDDSTVTAFHHGGGMDITSHDRCKVTLFEGDGAGQTAGVIPAKSNSNVDWTKWGTIFGALGLIATILVAVLS